ncbi:MAG: hybrid sensor histidine kinase/response regulator [Proteobacteria bacterium]|nr:hybrid sensor histidine kinase/response regulator [Pseudomonadota bacterium]
MTQGNGNDFSNMSMMDLFRMEAENHCAALSEDLLALEQSPADDELLESLMRASHSIKGAARIVNLNQAVLVAHAMEDVFVAAQKGEISLAKQSIDILLHGLDFINDIAKVADDGLDNWNTENKDRTESLTNNLTAIAKQETPASEKKTPATKTPDKKIEQKPEPQSAKPVSSGSLSDMSMMDLFRMEAENHCAALSEDLLALEQSPADDELLESLMRASHSIKGAARIVNLNQAVLVAHAMEDVFVAAQKGKITLGEQSIDFLLQGLDFINDIAKMPDDGLDNWNTENKDRTDSLTNNLTAIARQETPTPEKKAPATKASDKTIEKKTRSQPQETPEKQTSPEPPEVKPTLKTKPAPSADRALRVSSEGMNRLMGLAGEVQVESRWLPSFSMRILRLKNKQDQLHRLYESRRFDIKSESLGSRGEKTFKELQLKLEECRLLLNDYIAECEDHSRRGTEIAHRLYHEVLANRMRPFSEGVRGFPRMVRDLSHELGKDIHFEIIGPETMVDRDILEKIESPLNHLIRNSIDHGIESPEERLSSGKPSSAKIRLEARHSSGMLNITISDDGRGVDYEKIRQSIIEKNMTSREMAEDLKESELMDFLFLPNFSTRKKVSKVSGRGVGLDVVHSVVHEVRGVVRATSVLGKGTSFEMQLPLTLSVLRAMLVDICNEPYAFPLMSIDHVIKLPETEIKEVEGRQYFTLSDKRIGLLSARQILKKADAQNKDDELLIVIISDRLNQYGLIVDKFIGIHDLVVQTLDPRLGKIRDISAAAILEDGSPVLILDVEDLVRSMDNLISDNRLKRVVHLDALSEDRAVKRILVADDSITVREVERKMLSAKGYEVDVAVDGMDAWNAVREREYDLVVTDVDMPRMNGIELVNLIKKDPQLRSIPIIIVSYKDREEDRNRGLEAGADYYLTKGSFQDETLVNAVDDLIGAPEF